MLCSHNLLSLLIAYDQLAHAVILTYLFLFMKTKKAALLTNGMNWFVLGLPPRTPLSMRCFQHMESI